MGMKAATNNIFYKLYKYSTRHPVKCFVYMRSKYQKANKSMPVDRLAKRHTKLVKEFNKKLGHVVQKKKRSKRQGVLPDLP